MRRSRAIAGLAAAAALAAAACAPDEGGVREAGVGQAGVREAVPPEAPAPPNVVLVVGDGFGVGAWSMARVVAALDGAELTMDRPDAIGFLEPRALDALVTDSAAAATAWSTGRLAPRFRVGFPGEEGSSLFERLRSAGRACGFVSTARVTHYTLAPFYARAADRRAENAIAEQLVAAAPDVAIGGGARHFRPTDAGGKRVDGRDLLAEAERAGTAVLRRIDGPLPEDAPVLAVLAESHLPHEVDRAPGEPDLAELAVAAVRRLRAAGRPWFLLVEAARIDHAGHDHDGPGVVRNTLALDRALAALLEETDRARTLVVLAADHETANPTFLEYAHPESLGVVTASVEAIEERIFEGSRWHGTPRALEARALPVLDECARHTGLEAEDLDRLLAAADVYERRMAIGTALSRRFGISFIPWEDHRRSDAVHGHNGDLVPVRAWGARAEEVRGVRDHGALGRWLADVLALPPAADSGGTAEAESGTARRIDTTRGGG